MNDPSAALLDRVTTYFTTSRPESIGVAVSGGSDSLAMLMLMAQWSKHGGPQVHAVTVNHNLRQEAAQEATFVKKICDDLGVPHHTLTWEGWDGHGNLSDAARRARYRLMAEWAAAQGIPKIAVAHTLNDQAETFLMRLSREAGVDGLAQMQQSWTQGEVEFCRPVLHVSRDVLRTYLQAKGQSWVEDPSNTDETYERARARKAVTALEPLGISPEKLANVAQHMSEARQVIYEYVHEFAKENLTFDRGDVMVERSALTGLQRDASRRLLNQIILWISGADYAPRGKSVDMLLDAIETGSGMTLQGCEIAFSGNIVRFSREAKSVVGKESSVDDAWDTRWRLSGSESDRLHVAMLGEAGLKECENWRDSGLPAKSLIAGPAVWQGSHLVAAPLAGFSNGWSVDLLRDENHFFAALLAH